MKFTIDATEIDDTITRVVSENPKELDILRSKLIYSYSIKVECKSMADIDEAEKLLAILRPTLYKP